VPNEMIASGSREMLFFLKRSIPLVTKPRGWRKDFLQ
jgi:hypothetical protein